MLIVLKNYNIRKFMFKNFNKVLKIFKKYTLIDILFLILKKIKLINYNSLIEKKKLKLEKEIISLTKKRVVHGFYEGTYLNCRSNWGVGDYSSKLLGFYEMQVQEKIIELKKKYNLKYLINFGASDGYHLLGLIKNNYFDSALAYEINDKDRFNLNENLYLNNINEKVEIFSNADFEYIKNTFDDEKLKDTLYLVDIEGEEFYLFNEKNLNEFNKSILIIENHHFFISDVIKKDYFFKLINENFYLEFLYDGPRNPHDISEIKNYRDDDKWLMVSEGRICNQDWLVCVPKYRSVKFNGI
jgi:hypothetical protein